MGKRVGTILLLTALVGLWMAPRSFAAAVVELTVVPDDATLDIGQSTTVRIFAEVTSPMNIDDGIFAWNMNVEFSTAAVVAAVSDSVAMTMTAAPQGDPIDNAQNETLMSLLNIPGNDGGLTALNDGYLGYDLGTKHSLGISDIWMLYDHLYPGAPTPPAPIGVGGPVEIMSFGIYGVAAGQVNLTLSPSNTIGMDMTLWNSSFHGESFSTDYAGTSTMLTVSDTIDPNPIPLPSAAMAMLGLIGVKLMRRHGRGLK